MTATHKNFLKTTVSAVASSGLGALTISTASSGFRTFGAGDDGVTFDGITIKEGTSWEVRDGCVYTHSGTSLSRGTLIDSSTGSAIAFTSAAVVQQGPSAGFANKAEMLMDVFGASELSITGTATATIGRMHLCSGTSADYTVTLPAASGNAGKLIGFRMAPLASLSKLVTLDGNASETIDGATTRIMWASEVAILYCDGSNWFKIAGKSIPMIGHATLLTTVSLPNGVATKVNLAASQIDNTGMMVDASTNERINIKRTGHYIVSTGGGINNTSGPSSLYLRLYRNATNLDAVFCYFVASSYPALSMTIPVNLNSGDSIETYLQHYAGGTATGGTGTYMRVTEVPVW